MAADGSSDCPSAKRPKLLERVHDALAMRHYSPRTAEAYVAWMRRFIVFHNRRHPPQLGALRQDIGSLDDFVRVKKPLRLPVVMT